MREEVRMLQDGLLQIPIWVKYNGVPRKFEILSSLDTLMKDVFITSSASIAETSWTIKPIEVTMIDDVRAKYYNFYKIIISDNVSLNRDEYYAVKTPFFSEAFNEEKEKQINDTATYTTFYAGKHNAYAVGYTTDIVSVLKTAQPISETYIDVMWKQGVQLSNIKYFAEIVKSKQNEELAELLYKFLLRNDAGNSINVMYNIRVSNDDFKNAVNGEFDIKNIKENLKFVENKIRNKLDEDE